MDEAGARALIQRYLDESGVDPDAAHEMYHDDAVLEFPQSGERFEGVENFREWRRQYPEKVTFALRNLRGAGDLWIAEISVLYEASPPLFGISILESRGDKVAHETIYGAPPWEAPEWRAPWRATP